MEGIIVISILVLIFICCYISGVMIPAMYFSYQEGKQDAENKSGYENKYGYLLAYSYEQGYRKGSLYRVEKNKKRFHR